MKTKRMFLHASIMLLGFLLAALPLTPIDALAADQACKLRYRYAANQFDPAGNKWRTVTAQRGEIKNHPRKHVRYVKNTGDYDMKLQVKGLHVVWETLNVGEEKTYLVDLLKVQCLSTADGQRPPWEIAGEQTGNAATGALTHAVIITQPRVTAVSESAMAASYDAYFKLVVAGARMSRLNAKYIEALSEVDIDGRRIKIGFSPYLTASGVGMTDCNSIYFPNQALVDRLRRGMSINSDERWWLLHELGHTEQCLQAGRRGFAVRWWSELPPAAIDSVSSLSPDAVHDAMPLEQEADQFANEKRRKFEEAYKKALDLK